MSIDIREMTAEELLGPLNDVERKNAPERLYVAGNVELLKRGTRVSIVGSRKASSEGLQRTRLLAKALVEREIVVVSGLAEGVDTAATRPRSLLVDTRSRSSARHSIRSIP